MKAGHDPEESRACAAGRPQQVGVLGLVGVSELAVGADDVDRADVLAGSAVAA
jgi:hypothetical protein